MFLAKKMNLNLLTEKSGIIYEVFQVNDIEQTIACIIEAFPRGEPMAKALGITPDEYYFFAKIVCEKAVNDGLSVVAKDKATGQVIGFCISEDLASEPPEGLEKINVKLHPILALLTSLDEEYKKSHKVEKGQIFHLYMVGVREPYKSQNIATTLLSENLKLAKLKNFSGAITEATGLVSQRIIRDKLGFNEKFAIEYKSFTYKGENVFKNIENSLSCILLEKRFY
jgi:ribosomal protein S18 acetylase RimI-like enzyme